MILNMDKEQIQTLIKDHLEEVEPGCRWCFAVDMHRVTGKAETEWKHKGNKRKQEETERKHGKSNMKTYEETLKTRLI